MNLDYVPLLRVMRDIHSVPRGQPPDFNGMKRFRAYLRAIFDYDRNGSAKVCKLPTLLAMSKPFDYDTILKVQFILSRDIQLAFAPANQIVAALDRHYGQSSTGSVAS